MMMERMCVTRKGVFPSYPILSTTPFDTSAIIISINYVPPPAGNLSKCQRSSLIDFPFPLYPFYLCLSCSNERFHGQIALDVLDSFAYVTALANGGPAGGLPG